MARSTAAPERSSSIVARRAGNGLTAVEDILVFTRQSGIIRLIGGIGRGAGWADIVQLGADDAPLIERVWEAGLPARLDADAPVRVLGPYWAEHAAIVPLGDEHLVVFGSRRPFEATDVELVRAAANAVAQADGPSADKLLADELELVHAVRALMAYRPETVAETARHIAMTVANSLSCEYGAIQIQRGDGEVLEIVGTGPGSRDDHPLAGPDAAAYLRSATEMPEPRVEQTVDETARVWAAAIVSRLTLPLGTDAPLGALTVAHGEARPRGFTMLCQRIARVLAESAELLLSQAVAREQLNAERESLRRQTMTDPMTGLGNRAAWDSALAMAVARQHQTGDPFVVLTFDVDGLKAVNDRYGHAAGDALLRDAAGLLRASVRDEDLVARTGGDEFQILLARGDRSSARHVIARVRRRERTRRSRQSGPCPELSIGWATSDDEPETTTTRADARMYVSKRRRADRRNCDPHPSTAA